MQVAVIGCGPIGTEHTNAYSQIPEIEKIFFIDLQREKAQKLAQKYDGEVINSYLKLPDEIEAVSVTTPPQTHYEIVKTLLKKGYNVLCEKPLTMEYKQSKELMELSNKKQSVLMIGFKMRYTSIFVKIKGLLPQIGKIHGIFSSKVQPYNPKKPIDWIPNVGVMRELSIHDIDLINWFIEEKPVRVYAQLKHKFAWKKEDQFFSLIEYQNGVTAEIMGIYTKQFKWLGRDVFITIIGEKGYIRGERPDRITIQLDEYKEIKLNAENEDPFIKELKNFLNVIKGKEKPKVTAKDAYLADLIIGALELSAKRKLPIQLKEL